MTVEGASADEAGVETSPLPPLQLRRAPSEKSLSATQTRLPQVTPRAVGTPKEPTTKRRVQSAYVKRDTVNQTPEPVTKAPSPGKVSPAKARVKSLERIVTYKHAEKVEKEAIELTRAQKEVQAQAERDHALQAKARRRAEIYAINAHMRSFYQAKATTTVLGV
ncbi:hypothetical protein ACHHYP_17157 [Achlya hypogyna]|uniref:Uncharacterized protein n=1 Tax=Achlya hypogyna TaxID=1202772 RepID=A0A1V9Y521_ACHHY|nr:hypothetical protein ACHHYP_17157 [Achlya hypogyna]